MAERFVEGWTERIRYQLKSDGVVQPLTGMTVTMNAYDRTGTAVTWTGVAGIDDILEGIVYFDPAAADLVAADSPYQIRWKVTDGLGKVAFYPKDDPEEWPVSL